MPVDRIVFSGSSITFKPIQQAPNKVLIRYHWYLVGLIASLFGWAHYVVDKKGTGVYINKASLKDVLEANTIRYNSLDVEKCINALVGQRVSKEGLIYKQPQHEKYAKAQFETQIIEIDENITDRLSNFPSFLLTDPDLIKTHIRNFANHNNDNAYIYNLYLKRLTGNFTAQDEQETNALLTRTPPLSEDQNDLLKLNLAIWCLENSQEEKAFQLASSLKDKRGEKIEGDPAATSDWLYIAAWQIFDIIRVRKNIQTESLPQFLARLPPCTSFYSIPYNLDFYDNTIFKSKHPPLLPEDAQRLDPYYDSVTNLQNKNFDKVLGALQEDTSPRAQVLQALATIGKGEKADLTLRILDDKAYDFYEAKVLRLQLSITFTTFADMLADLLYAISSDQSLAFELLMQEIRKDKSLIYNEEIKDILALIYALNIKNFSSIPQILEKHEKTQNTLILFLKGIYLVSLSKKTKDRQTQIDLITQKLEHSGDLSALLQLAKAIREKKSDLIPFLANLLPPINPICKLLTGTLCYDLDHLVKLLNNPQLTMNDIFYLNSKFLLLPDNGIAKAIERWTEQHQGSDLKLQVLNSINQFDPDNAIALEATFDQLYTENSEAFLAQGLQPYWKTINFLIMANAIQYGNFEKAYSYYSKLVMQFNVEGLNEFYSEDVESSNINAFKQYLHQIENS